jgi:hypothetical protein
MNSVNTNRNRRSPWKTAVGALVCCALGIASCAALLRASHTYPWETLIFVGVFTIAAGGIVLYVGQLFLLGWIVDFLDSFGRPKSAALSVPLECEQVGHAIIVHLRDNIANADECKSVERQLQRVIQEHCCNFVLDFSAAGRISIHFRSVLVNLKKTARREAESLGRPYHPMALPQGEMFPVFQDSQQALEEMTRYGGHGWVALCCVPVGVRAVSSL